MGRRHGFDRLSDRAREAAGQLDIDSDANASALERDNLLLVAHECGAEIETRSFAGGAWQEPIAVTARLAKRTDEECWSHPFLVIGPDGLPWLFYMSEIRRTTYYHRWLGGDWSQRLRGRTVFHAEPFSNAVFDENLLPISKFEVSGEEGEPVEHVLATDEYPYIECTHSIDAPQLEAKPGAGELFADTRGVARTENLTWTTNVTRKHPRNPIFRPTFKPGTPDEGGVMNHGTVLLEDGKFRMWYAAWEIEGHGPTPAGRNWHLYMNICYAESEDGIEWHRPNLGLVDYMGNKDNNIVPGFWCVPLVVRDDLEPDPERRYKGFDEADPSPEFPNRAAILPTSPDGLNWKTQEVERSYSVIMPYADCWMSVIRDEDDPNKERLWKAYGFFSPTGRRRTGGCTFSPDGIHWTGYPENPIIDPLQGAWTGCHDFVVWRERGLYIGLLQVCDETKKNSDLELVVSRDGIHFTRVADGRLFISRGSEGEWDPGTLCAFGNPVFVGDETWFYYSSSTKVHVEFDYDEDEKDWTHRPCNGGLALIRTGRYAGFGIQDERGSGSLVTVPIRTAPNMKLGLNINADCGSGGEIRVGLEDAATGEAIPGYSADDCDPITSDEIAAPVRWKGRSIIEPMPKAVRLRFSMKGPAKIYGFEWVTREERKGN